MKGATVALEQSGDAWDSVLEKARQGERQAFDALIGRFEEQVLKTALGLTRNLHDAQDVAQEVYIKIFRRLKRLENPSKMRSWVYRITVNTARDHLRRQRFWMPLKGIFARAPAAPDPVQGSQLRSRLAAALARLSFNERACFILSELHEIETRQVAEILGCRAVTVRGYLHSARKKLRMHLESFRGEK